MKISPYTLEKLGMLLSIFYGLLAVGVIAVAIATIFYPELLGI